MGSVVCTEHQLSITKAYANVLCAVLSAVPDKTGHRRDTRGPHLAFSRGRDADDYDADDYYRRTVAVHEAIVAACDSKPVDCNYLNLYVMMQIITPPHSPVASGLFVYICDEPHSSPTLHIDEATLDQFISAGLISSGDLSLLATSKFASGQLDSFGLPIRWWKAYGSNFSTVLGLCSTKPASAIRDSPV